MMTDGKQSGDHCRAVAAPSSSQLLVISDAETCDVAAAGNLF